MADRFDKFTDRARRALQTAHQEAERLGHGHIGAEHLLLGLLADRTSIAARALVQLSVDLDTLIARAAVQDSGQDPPQLQIGLGASAKEAIELAVEEARALNHHFVGTEHLLLGLVRQAANPAAEELHTRGVTLPRLRLAVVTILAAPATPGARPVSPPPPEADDEHRFEQLASFLANPTGRSSQAAPEWLERFSASALDVLGFAVAEAQRLNHTYVGTEHLLLGLVRDSETAVGQLLLELGVDLSKVRDGVELIIGHGDPTIVLEPSFTPRARKVVLLALDEAQRLGQPAAGAEHLLLGIVREGEGIASGVLESLLINPDTIRTQLLEFLGQPLAQAPAAVRTHRLTRQARRALLQAQLTARWYYHPRVDTEHLLVGLVRERGSVASDALHALGADLPRTLLQLEALTGEPGGGPAPERVEYTPAAQSAIDRASQEAAQRSHPHAGSGHLLVGVLASRGGRAGELLDGLGISADRLRESIEPRLANEAD